MAKLKTAVLTFDKLPTTINATHHGGTRRASKAVTPSASSLQPLTRLAVGWSPALWAAAGAR